MLKNKQNSKAMILSIAITAVFTALIWMLQFVPMVGFIVIPPGLSMTTIHIPVLIGIIALPRTKWNIAFGGFIGFMFGMASWVTALTRAVNPSDLLFQNPLISVLPRALMGIAVAAFWLGAKKIGEKKHGDISLMAMGALVISGLAYFFFARVSGTDYALNRLVGLSVAIILIVVLVALFVLLRKKIKMINSAAVITTLALGTLFNTVFVLTALRVFEGLLFIDTSGLVGNIIQIGLISNGSVEMIAAVVLGLPIVLAINKLKKSQNLQ